MLAPLLLALALGQACPQPLSAGDPPPCAAASVAGCLPGYGATRDRHGRLIYVCAAAPAVAARPPAVIGIPPPAAAPLEAPPPPEGGRGRVAIVLMPGQTTDPALGVRGGRDLDRFAAAADLEVRGQRGGGRLRVQLQYTELGRVAELGLKYDFFDWTPLRPFLGVAAGASSLDADARWRASGSVFGGIDLYLDRNAFLSAEIQGRRFVNRTSDAGRRLDVSDRRQTTALVGIGFYL